jgi:hypothetical protein
MQRLNEDFLDTLNHQDVTGTDKEELTDNEQKEPHEFRFWLTIGTLGVSNLEEDYVIERIRKVLERCIYITSWSKIYAKRSPSYMWMSQKSEDDPISFGFDADFKNVASVMRFLESLRYIFGSSMNIAMTLTEKNATEEATINTVHLDNIKAPLKGEKLNPHEFFPVVKMVEMFLSPEHDVINELNNFIGKGDYSSWFRQTLLKETISTLKYSRRNMQLPAGGKISDVDEFKSLHVPISHIAAVEKDNPDAYIQIGISNAYIEYAVPLLRPASYVAQATFDDYLGLIEIIPSSISMTFISQLGMEANSRFICVVYGNNYRNGYGVLTLAGLVIATKTKEEMEKVLNEIFAPVEIKILAVQDRFGQKPVDWKSKNDSQ